MRFENEKQPKGTNYIRMKEETMRKVFVLATKGHCMMYPFTNEN